MSSPPRFAAGRKQSSRTTSVPRSALAPYSITAQGPSTFLKNLYELDPEGVGHTLEQQAAAINKSFAYLLDRLRVNVPGFVQMFTQQK